VSRMPLLDGERPPAALQPPLAAFVFVEAGLSFFPLEPDGSPSSSSPPGLSVFELSSGLGLGLASSLSSVLSSSERSSTHLFALQDFPVPHSNSESVLQFTSPVQLSAMRPHSTPFVRFASSH